MSAFGQLVVLLLALRGLSEAAAKDGGGTGMLEKPKLRFSTDGTFKLVQFTDSHFGESPDSDQKTIAAQEAILAAESPDLAVLSGDQVSGFAWDGSRRWYAKHWRQLTQPLHAAGVPYAAILGNHDAEGDLSRREIVDLDVRMGGNLSLTQPGPQELSGAGNYWLDVLEPQGEGVAARIWMLDSGSRGCESTRAGWGCVGSDVLAWVAQQAAGLPSVPTSLAFVHIPLPQMMHLWAQRPTNGSKGEPTACPLVDTGALATLRGIGVQAIYSGHDHDNDFVGELEEGVRLGYGRKTGFANYGPPPDTAHGARVVVLRQGQSAAGAESWIRNEFGGREDQGPTPEGEKRAGGQDRCGADPLLLQLIRDAASGASRWTTAALVAALVAAAAALLLRLRGPLGGCRPLGALCARGVGAGGESGLPTRCHSGAVELGKGEAEGLLERARLLGPGAEPRLLEAGLCPRPFEA